MTRNERRFADKIASEWYNYLRVRGHCPRAVPVGECARLSVETDPRSAIASKVEDDPWSRLTPMEIDALVMLARAVTELRRLSHAQREMLFRVGRAGSDRAPVAGGASRNLAAVSGWHRTAASLARRGIVRIERSGDMFRVVMPREAGIDT